MAKTKMMMKKVLVILTATGLSSLALAAGGGADLPVQARAVVTQAQPHLDGLRHA